MNISSEFHESTVLRTMFDSATEGLLVVDSSGIIKIVNPRMNELFGYSEDELIDQSLQILIPEHVKGRHEGHRKSYMDNPKKRTMGAAMDLSGVKKDGSQIPIEVSLNYFKKDSETYVMAMIIDISVRKLAEQKLQEMNMKLESLISERTKALRTSQNLYSEIARNFPKGTINVFDKDLNYIFVEGEDLYKAGITSERLVGTSYLSHLPEEIRENIKEELGLVFEGEKRSFEVNIDKGAYLMNCVPLLDYENQISQILVVEQNITKQKQAEDDMKTALSKEKELSELKSRFVSMASHEFRTPLSTILSSAGLLSRYLKKGDLDKSNKHIGRIKSNVENLTNILNDFLSLSKLEEGKIHSKPSTFNITEFVYDLVEELQVSLGENRKIEFSHEGKNEVWMDQPHLRNILSNLISNAFKYSKEDKAIEVKSILKNGMLEINVIDQGIGIPLDEQENLFERFFRAKNATNIQGTGLGLNIVKRFVDLMGGEIKFQSEPGKGSIFTVTLPTEKNT